MNETDGEKPAPAENSEVRALKDSDLKTTDSAQEESWHDIECYIQNYVAIAEWIRFADAKAAVILTVSGAAAGFLIPTIGNVVADQGTDHLFGYWRPIVIILFAFYLLFFLMSNIVAFLCINPFRRKGRHPALDHCDHFHPAAIAASYDVDDHASFVRDITEGGAETLRKEIHVGILLDSHISKYKYGKVTQSLKLFGVSVIFAFLYFLALQL